MDNNWIVENLTNAFGVWNSKMTEMWSLLTESPQTFKGGTIWQTIVTINGGMQAIGYGLLVLFFAIGIFRSSSGFRDFQRPEHLLRHFIYFVLAKLGITYGMDLLVDVFDVCSGIVATAAGSIGGLTGASVALPQEIADAIGDVGFLASIPLWLVTLLGSLFITVLAFIMILTVYGRFFKIYMYAALSPVALASFAGEGTSHFGKAFLRSYVWGKSSAKDLQEQRKRIGCMIETPALFPAMTAYQNMEIQRIQRGIPDKTVIEKTLNVVGLKDTGKKSVRNFSLGMRQRLGIAIALLNTPEFLILDEPINGLDPAGIVEVRNLLKSLNKEYGMTILVSSHILEELYQTATEFILIDKGKIIEEISDQELNERCKRHIAIKATDPQKALLVLEEKLHTENFKLMPDGTIRLYDYLDDLEKVAAVLSDAHILVTGLSVSGDTLEDYFLSKIGGSENVKSPKY